MDTCLFDWHEKCRTHQDRQEPAARGGALSLEDNGQCKCSRYNHNRRPVPNASQDNRCRCSAGVAGKRRLTYSCDIPAATYLEQDNNYCYHDCQKICNSASRNLSPWPWLFTGGWWLSGALTWKSAPELGR